MGRWCRGRARRVWLYRSLIDDAYIFNQPNEHPGMPRAKGGKRPARKKDFLRGLRVRPKKGCWLGCARPSIPFMWPSADLPSCMCNPMYTQQKQRRLCRLREGERERERRGDRQRNESRGRAPSQPHTTHTIQQGDDVIWSKSPTANKKERKTSTREPMTNNHTRCLVFLGALACSLRYRHINPSTALFPAVCIHPHNHPHQSSSVGASSSNTSPRCAVEWL